MRSFFSIVVIFAVLLVGGGWVYLRQQDEKARVKMAEDLASARRTFAQKARSAAQEETTEGYLRSINGAIAAYKDELKTRVYKDPKKWDVDAYKKELEAKFAKGEVPEDRKKSMLEGFEIVKTAYELLTKGQWRPVLTAKGAADTRLDLYTLDRVADPDGAPVLAGKFFFWGIEDSTDVRWGELKIKIWRVDREKVKQGRQLVETDVPKVHGESSTEAQPHLIIQRPHNYIESFPSFVSIGELWLSRPLPRESKWVDLSYSYRTKTPGGGEVESTLKWDRLEVPESWKLKEGEAWEADVVEATEEEIAGKPPKEE